MPEATVRRTLVKSPPELWAEVSDTAALARHLGEFGEIRITRTDPETTVAWEGDRARGTVELEASGWGTKVTITAEPSTPTEVGPPVDEAEPAEAEAEPAAVIAPEPVAPVAPEPVAETPVAAVAPEPVSAEPVAVAPPPSPAVPPAKKPGFLARLFGRRRPAAEAPPADPAPAPVVPLPVPVPAPEPVEVPPAAVAPVAEPAAASPAPVEAVPAPEPETAPTAPAPVALDAPAVEKILSGVLDDLGAAHHRPFSRS